MKKSNKYSEEKRIAFIIVFMGELPWYFPYFSHSCRYNPSIDFIILSDNKITPTALPQNVKLIYYTIDQFKADASKALGFNVVVEHGYKLCDFKPAYGYIFEDLVKDYTFCGYCDMDVIWGNIRLFMTDTLLNNYEIISARHDYLTGSFTLYRNNKKMRELFMQSKDYQKVFTSTENFCFDETNFAFEEFEAGIHYSQIKTEVESMTHVVRRLQEIHGLKAYFEFQIIEGFAGNILWDHGTLVYRREFEAMFYHLVRFKVKYSEATILNKIIPDKFRIGKNKIY